MYDIEVLRREEFPVSAEYIYFNHASISPLPIRTRNKVQWATDQLAANPSNHFAESGMAMLMRFSEEFAKFVNASSPQEIVSITSTGSGINAIAQAFVAEPGDNLVFCDMEFPTNAYPWMSRERDGIEARLVPSVNGGLTLEALKPYVDSRTKLVAVSAVQFFSGHRTDLAPIGAFCRERGIIFVVDVIQSAGHIPIDVQSMNIDVVVTGGQKSLLALPATGFMYVRNEVAEKLQPRMISANSTKDYAFWLDYDLTPLPGAARFASGMPNVVGMYSLLESLTLLNELGVANIDHHTTGLAAETIEVLTRLGYEVVTEREEHGPIVTFKTGLDSDQSDAMVNKLREQKVNVVKHFDKNKVSHLRVSFHCYNTVEEIYQFAELIKGYTP